KRVLFKQSQSRLAALQGSVTGARGIWAALQNQATAAQRRQVHPAPGENLISLLIPNAFMSREESWRRKRGIGAVFLDEGPPRLSVAGIKMTVLCSTAVERTLSRTHRGEERERESEGACPITAAGLRSSSSHFLSPASLPLNPHDSQPPFILLPPPPFVSVLSSIHSPHSSYPSPENTDPPMFVSFEGSPHIKQQSTCDFIQFSGMQFRSSTSENFRITHHHHQT
ncbi:hypothetical protein DNTS_032314, partial [Danionella cerebrum]